MSASEQDLKSPTCKPPPNNPDISQENHSTPHRLSSFRSALQLPLSWTSFLLTTVLVILTTVYASQPTRIHFLYSSSSNTIFVLSMLSGVTGLFLGTTIAAAFERLQWVLVATGGEGGVSFGKFLGLDAGTGVAGLLALIAGKGYPVLSSTRAWGLTKLLAKILIPVLGILIMSNVNTRIAFDVLDSASQSLGWGMGLYNASLTKNISIIADQLIQAELVMFLSDPIFAVDITPSSLRSIPCSSGPNSENATRCERSFFIPGGADLAAPEASRNGGPLETVFLAKDQQGYVLEFQEGDDRWEFDDAVSCQTYGFPFAAFYFCLKNTADNIIDARIVQCPTKFSGRLQCWSDSSWHTDPGWQTRLTASFRRATVAYSTTNGTILSHVFSDTKTIPAPVNATEMLRGYLDAYGNFSSIQDILSLMQDPDGTNKFPLYVYPVFVWATLKGVANIGPINPAVVSRGADVLQCLLAITLRYSQASIFARAISAKNITGDDNFKKFAADILAAAPADTPISLAGLRYQIVVGKATLIAYVVLTGTALALCFIALLLGSYSPVASNVPETSPFPAWNSTMLCSVKSYDDSGSPCDIVPLRQLTGSKLVRAATNIKVRLG